jgi:hypothetical protein
MVSWLPTFHDLGLVYGVFMPLYVGFHGVLLDPLHFLQRPMRWLEAIASVPRHARPGAELRVRALRGPSPPPGSGRGSTCGPAGSVALNGAEPIRYESEAALRRGLRRGRRHLGRR